MKKQITATLSEMLRTVHMHHLLIFYFSHMFVDVDRNFNFFSSSRLISSFWKTNENKTDVVQTTKAYFRRWHWSLQTHKTGFSGRKLQFRCISNYCVFFILFYFFFLNEEKKSNFNKSCEIQHQLPTLLMLSCRFFNSHQTC